MTETERNYDIYDREMLAIHDALKDWRHFLEGLPQPFEIWTDHQNLKFWQTAQNLSRRQARWAIFLADFNFVLVHKPGSSNTRADPLSRLSSHEVTDSDDNRELLEWYGRVTRVYVAISAAPWWICITPIKPEAIVLLNPVVSV